MKNVMTITHDSMEQRTEILAAAVACSMGNIRILIDSTKPSAEIELLLYRILINSANLPLYPEIWLIVYEAVVLNLAGLLGAFAGINFTMDFLRGFLSIIMLS